MENSAPDQALPLSRGLVPDAGRERRGIPLSRYLNPDGTLDLPPEAIQGSLDPTGFRLVAGPGDSPRFESAPVVPCAADDNWDSRFSMRGTNSGVGALAWDGTSLYVGGSFTIAGDADAAYVARWDGTKWSTLGAGFNGRTNALAWHGSHLYAGGYFTFAGDTVVNHIAKWDGVSWSALGSGTNLEVYALAWEGDTLVVGGVFSKAGGAPANSIAKWDGFSWTPLGAGFNGTVYSLAFHQGTLYAGGNFTKSGSTAINRIARWDGATWNPLGSGTNGNVYALASDGTRLYAGGGFSQAGGLLAPYIARWDGTSWSALGTGMNDVVLTLAVSGGALYAGGNFTKAGGGAAARIARWDGSTWGAMGAGLNSSAVALLPVGTGLYAGGSFYLADAAFAGHIAKWDGASWAPLPETGAGLSSASLFTAAMAMVWGGGDLFAGGSFKVAGGVAAENIARWDGANWHPLGTGVNGEVYALAWDGTNLFAGGDFTMAGGIPARYVARWYGANWNALGTGPPNGVLALAWHGSRLYAGCWFDSLQNSGIFTWDGANWAPLGSGLNGDVYALASDGQKLYAGGSFWNSGGTTVLYIAMWDGMAWHPLGTGMDHYVYALAWDGTSLYASGDFGTPGWSLARWNGNQWSDLASFIDYPVSSLVAGDGVLYVGGMFDRIGGVHGFRRIAKYEGGTWAPLGSGVSDSVTVLALGGDGGSKSLFVGGEFSHAGGKPSSFIARWTPCTMPSGLGVITAADADPCSPSGVLITWPQEAGNWGDVSANSRTYDVLRDGTPILTGRPYSGPWSFTDTTGAPGVTYTYSVRYINGCGESATAAGVQASDLDAPGAPSIASVSDNDICLQSGVSITYTPGSGAARHDLYVDGNLGQTAFVSGGTHNPGNTASHVYFMRAVRDICSTDSASSVFADAKASVAISPASLPGALAGTAYSQSLIATGGTDPYSFAVTAGALPAGLSLSAPGHLSGTLTAGGSYSFTVTATDANGCMGSRVYTVDIAAFNLFFSDDAGRSRVCANSVTGSWTWTVLSGQGIGSYSGVSTVSRLNGTLTFTAPPSSPYAITLRYLELYRKASGSFIFRVGRISSTLLDNNTANDPPGC